MDELELRAWRKGERARLIEARMSMPLDEHRACSEVISRHLADRFPPERLPLLGCYWPFKREYDCIPLMRRVIDAGGAVALPVVVAKAQPLVFRPWTPGCRMEEGIWSTIHPADGDPVYPGALLVPLVGFDAQGYRLGYGGGFYDRTLASFPKLPLTIGVGFESQRMQTIHPQPFDVPMDYIVTEAGVVHTLKAHI